MHAWLIQSGIDSPALFPTKESHSVLSCSSSILSHRINLNLSLNDCTEALFLMEVFPDAHELVICSQRGSRKLSAGPKPPGVWAGW